MIVLATPTRDSVTAGFTGDLVKLCRRHTDVRFLAALGVYLPNLRQHAVTTAQQTGASHILFIDSDMRFPADTLDWLLAADVDIIGANYVQRTMPEWWTARLDGQSLSSVGRSGRQRVDSLGFGAVLINLRVFDLLPRPWFAMPYEGQQHLGEDVYFCRLAHASGLDVWIDHDLSQAVRHQATVEYGVESVQVEAIA